MSECLDDRLELSNSVQYTKMHVHTTNDAKRFVFKFNINDGSGSLLKYLKMEHNGLQVYKVV